MSGHSTYVPKTAIGKWFEARLPVVRLLHDTAVSYPTPRNLNALWTFGGILAMMLVVQIVTGIVLAMHYAAESHVAFRSVESIMRDVNWGWLIRYLHANGASMFFIAVYIHIFRGLYYGSYKAPREILWILGVIIYLLMMAAAFMGYVLPWGQMSFWGATVITNFFTALPIVGQPIQTLLIGGFSVDNADAEPLLLAALTLLPFMIAGVVVLHVWALHVVGQNNPTRHRGEERQRTPCPSRPTRPSKDVFWIVRVHDLFYGYFVFYQPNFLGHPDNYIEANPLATPAHIVPEWYFLPFYAILRAIDFNLGPIDSKLGGVLAMFGAIAVLAFLPWLDTSKVRSGRFRPIFKVAFWLFGLNALFLGFLGSVKTDDIIMGAQAVVWAKLSTLYYFLYFLVILPLLGYIEKPKPLPVSINDAILAKSAH